MTNNLNEMRKLMEAVEQVNEESEKTAADVLQYFSNKRHGGSIKNGYKGFLDIDGSIYEIDRINILYRRGERPTVTVTGPWQGGYQVGMPGIARMEIYKLDRVL